MSETGTEPRTDGAAQTAASEDGRGGTLARVRAALEGVAHDVRPTLDGMLTLEVARADLRAVLERLHGRAGFNQSTLVTAVDRYPAEPRFEVVHQLLSVPRGDRVRVRTRVAEDDASVASARDLWPGSSFSERECFDLLGVRFEGHGDLRRLMMPETYTHHPLRKDFPHQGIEPDRLYRLWDRERRDPARPTPEPDSPAIVRKTYEYAPGSTDDLDEDDPLHGELMRMNMGPQHPATHGVLRLVITIDGETMRAVDPVVGYLHRGKEKSCETLGWRKFFPHTDRLDYVQPLMNNIGYAMALERLAGLEVPERGQIIRVLLMELSRIMAHLIYIGTTGIDLGAVTIFFYSFAEREKMYDILDEYTGHRMNNTYVRVGGVYADIDEQVARELERWLDEFPAKVDELESLLTGNRIWHDRNRDVGVLTPQQAIAWSLTGPSLRGSGLDWDLRKARPYSGYEQYDFEVPVGTIGDCYDRYLVRMEEMRQSVRIAKQALARLRETRGGDFLAQDRRYVLPPKSEVHTSMEELIHQFKIVTDMSLPRGEAYHGIESSKGELGFYVVSDGTSHPVRCHIRAPGLMNVQAIPLLAEGRLLSDMVAIIGSLDFVMGEVDR